MYTQSGFTLPYEYQMLGFISASSMAIFQKSLNKDHCFITEDIWQYNITHDNHIQNSLMSNCHD